MSILPKKWESKIIDISEARDLNKMAIYELIGNLKTYEMFKKFGKLETELKAEKKLFLKDTKETLMMKMRRQHILQREF